VKESYRISISARERERKFRSHKIYVDVLLLLLNIKGVRERESERYTHIALHGTERNFYVSLLYSFNVCRRMLLTADAGNMTNVLSIFHAKKR
jgi:hypothetical protein